MKPTPLLLLLLLTGCPAGERTDVDTDTDSNSEGSVDPDIDTDSDTDTDVDTDTDSDPDVGTDTDVDTDPDTDPLPIDLGLVRTSSTVGNNGFDGLISVMVPTPQAVVSGTASGPGVQVAPVEGGAMLTLDPSERDWREANPQLIDVQLTLESGSAAQIADGQWRVSVLPEHATVSWNGTDMFLDLPSELAAGDGGALRISGDDYVPVVEQSEGLWVLAGEANPRSDRLSRLCVTAGDNGGACFNDATMTFNGTVLSRYDLANGQGAQGRLDMVKPYDWNQDSAIDVEDLASWLEGPPCRELESDVIGHVLEVGPLDDVITEPVQSQLSIESLIGAPVTEVEAVFSTYGGEGRDYEVIAPIPEASVVRDGDDIRLSVPASVYDFRQTNPYTVHVALEATDEGGRCYRRTALWSTSAVPNVIAAMWIDGVGYVGAGAAVAPRRNSLYFDGGFGIYTPLEEVVSGVFSLSPEGEPDGTRLNLVYFSAGNRFATFVSEALITSFNVLETSDDVLIMRGRISGGSSQRTEVHFVQPFDYSGDDAITAEDVAAYLESLVP